MRPGSEQIDFHEMGLAGQHFTLLFQVRVPAWSGVFIGRTYYFDDRDDLQARLPIQDLEVRLMHLQQGHSYHFGSVALGQGKPSLLSCGFTPAEPDIRDYLAVRAFDKHAF